MTVVMLSTAVLIMFTIASSALSSLSAAGLVGGHVYYDFADACVYPNSSSGVKLHAECATTGQAKKLRLMRNITAFSSSLRFKTILFIGDSTIRNQFVSLCESMLAPLLQYTESGTNMSCTFTNHGRRAAGGSSYSGGTRAPGGGRAGAGGRALFLGYGRVGSWAETLEDSHLALIAATVAALTPRDVVLFGAAVHWHYFCADPLQPHELASMKNYEFAFLRLLRLLLPVPPPSTTAACPPQLLQDQGRTSPRLVFRESLPQHFDTSNGQYSPRGSPRPARSSVAAAVLRNRGRSSGTSAAFADTGAGAGAGAGAADVNTGKQQGSGKQLSGGASCRSLNSHSIAGGGRTLSRTCEPNCLPASWQNHLALRLIHVHTSPTGCPALPAAVEVLHVFRHLECMGHAHPAPPPATATSSHPPPLTTSRNSKINSNSKININSNSNDRLDCGHYRPPVDVFLNYLFLELLFPAAAAAAAAAADPDPRTMSIP